MNGAATSECRRESVAHDAAFYEDMWAMIRREGVRDGEIIDRRKDGEQFVVELPAAT